MENKTVPSQNGTKSSLLMSERASLLRRLASNLAHGFLFVVASVTMLTLFFIIYVIARDAIPFFQIEGFKEFFTSTAWYPSHDPGKFGALAIFFGSAIVTLGAVIVSVPLGVAAAISLSDVMPFNIRQMVKPVIEILAAIPSVVYGFFALVIFAPMLQNHGGNFLAVAIWAVGLPILTIVVFMVSDIVQTKYGLKKSIYLTVLALFEIVVIGILYYLSSKASAIQISSGTNALNVSVILGIMALPTIVSVSEDALQAVGRDLREGSYALGATRAETLLKVVLPAASSGIIAAVILGTMRALGETMVVWMASGNAAQIPEPFYNLFEPIRTLTATIAGDMGEADQSTGSARFHVLFAMGLCLLVFSFVSNLVSEWIVVRSRKKLKGS